MDDEPSSILFFGFEIHPHKTYGSSLFCVGIRQAGISALNSIHPEKDVQWSAPIRLQSLKEDVWRANRAINIQPLRGWRMAFKPFGISYLGIHPEGSTVRKESIRVGAGRLSIFSPVPRGQMEDMILSGLPINEWKRV